MSGPMEGPNTRRVSASSAAYPAHRAVPSSGAGRIRSAQRAREPYSAPPAGHDTPTAPRALSEGVLGAAEAGNGVPFTLMHAAGNRFMLVDALDGLDLDWPALAKATAHPNFAIGHDGILVVLPGESLAFRQRMFDPDGTEDMCGNGLRCTAKHLFDTRRIGLEPVQIETISGPRGVQVLGSQPPTATVRTRLAVLEVRRVSLSLSGNPPPEVAEALAHGVYVNMGTPHLVLMADWEPLGPRWEEISAALETHPDLPERVTVTWVRPEGPGRLAPRFWERNVGETLACGTGSCAAVVVARQRAAMADAITVATRGGDLTVRWDGQGEIELTGPATTICRGTWPMGP
jgi:diaminopimelate epimerase